MKRRTKTGWDGIANRAIGDVGSTALVAAEVVTAASVLDPASTRLPVARLGGACKQLRKLWVDGTYRGKLGTGARIIVCSCYSPCCGGMTGKGLWSCLGAGWWSEHSPGPRSVVASAKTTRACQPGAKP